MCGRNTTAGLVNVISNAPSAQLEGRVASLEACLRSGDARAEDALAQLESLLAAGMHTDKVAAPLAALRPAVADIEYAAALDPLAALSAQLASSREAAAGTWQTAGTAAGSRLSRGRPGRSG